MPNKAKLVTRSASTTSVVADSIPKSDTLTHIELDSNLLNLRDATFGIAGDDSATIDVGMGNTLKIAGTQNVTTAATGQTVTITGPDLSSYATTTYVDNKVNANNTLTIADDTSTTSAINLDNTLQVLGGHNITTSISGSTLTIAGDKIIDVNEINSGDSSAIQINDAVNISGTLNAKTIVTNDIFSGDSTAVQILDGLGVGGNLGVTGSVSSPTHIQMGNGSATTLVAGRMWYNESNGTWNLGMGNGNITQQVGEELFRYGKASATITDSPLQLIYKTGTVGASGVITFAPAIAGITDSDQIIGCATESIALNGFGRVTTYGVINNITTDGSAYGETWADNDDIYYNPSTGGLTKTIPTSGLKMLIGTVINASSGGSGKFIVKLGVATFLSKLTDVTLSSLTANDTLRYNGTAWVNTPSKIIDVNEISSSDSTAIQVNDSLNVSGTLTANTFSTTNISSTSANGDISITPNGTGNVVLSADTVQIGDSNADATITTNGTGDLILNTNNGSSSGSITIADAANGNITLKVDGTGKVIAGDEFTATNLDNYTNVSNSFPGFSDIATIKSNLLFTSTLAVPNITTFAERHLNNAIYSYGKADSSSTTYNDIDFRWGNTALALFDMNGATADSTVTGNRGAAIRGMAVSTGYKNSGGGTKTTPNQVGFAAFNELQEGHTGDLTVVNQIGMRAGNSVRANTSEFSRITNSIGFISDTAAVGGTGASGTNRFITNEYAFYDAPTSSATLVTNHYGFYVNTGSAATNKYAFYSADDTYLSRLGTVERVLEKQNALTSSSTITVDADLAPVHTVTLGINTQFGISNLSTGQTVTLIIRQDVTGSRTATFTSDTSTAVKFAGGVSTLSTAGSAIDIVKIYNDGTNLLGKIEKAYA